MYSRCPSCDTPVEFPRGNPDAAGCGTHTSRDCPNCHSRRIFYSQSDFVQRWRLDDRERRSRERLDSSGG
jgi:hypothetical protein